MKQFLFALLISALTYSSISPWNNSWFSSYNDSFNYDNDFSYTIRSTQYGDYVSGPNGYFGTGKHTGNNYYYSDSNGYHGYGRNSGNNFYWNSW